MDHLIALGYVDASRLAITGTSYGGFLTAWAIGHTDRFKAAMAGAPVVNAQSFFGTSDIPTWVTWEYYRPSVEVSRPGSRLLAHQLHPKCEDANACHPRRGRCARAVIAGFRAVSIVEDARCADGTGHLSRRTTRLLASGTSGGSAAADARMVRALRSCSSNERWSACAGAMIVSRREFLEAASAMPAAALARSMHSASRFPKLTTDHARLRRDIEGLSQFGRPDGGEFGDGVSRVGFSQADVSGRAWVMRLMREARLSPSIDPAGNIFAVREGTEPGLAPILFGSHIDSVPEGGNYDGPLGSLAAIEVVRLLDTHGERTRHPLEVVVWANEEGVAFGKPLSAAVPSPGAWRTVSWRMFGTGCTRRTRSRRIGGDPARI